MRIHCSEPDEGPCASDRPDDLPSWYSRPDEEETDVERRRREREEREGGTGAGTGA